MWSISCLEFARKSRVQHNSTVSSTTPLWETPPHQDATEVSVVQVVRTGWWTHPRARAPGKLAASTAAIWISPAPVSVLSQHSRARCRWGWRLHPGGAPRCMLEAGTRAPHCMGGLPSTPTPKLSVDISSALNVWDVSSDFLCLF